jgi:hypothetical protein
VSAEGEKVLVEVKYEDKEQKETQIKVTSIVVSHADENEVVRLRI